MNNPNEYSLLLKDLFKKTTNPKLNLSRMDKLVRAIGFNKGKIKIIQVVGTNGKGSTCAFLEAILNEYGYNTGLFTSPHLITARERMRVNKKIIDEDHFIRIAKSVLDKSFQLGIDDSFFECMLATALLFFMEQKVDFIILEAGLGGRLDATSAINADILGVTHIDLDHQNILGNTLADIAKEKIYAAKAKEKVITVEQAPDAMAQIVKAEKNIGFELHQISSHNLKEQDMGLYGSHQEENANLAINLALLLGLRHKKDHIIQGLKKVYWPGRFEIINHHCPIVLDGAHNPNGIRTLTKSLNNHRLFKNKNLNLIYGSMMSPHADEKITMLLNNELFFNNIFLHSPDNPRAQSIDELKNIFNNHSHHFNSIYEFTTMDNILAMTKPNEVIVVCGSLYTVGDIRASLLDINKDLLSPNF